jgi:intein-encoded DNA endonuclease-like protein
VCDEDMCLNGIIGLRKEEGAWKMTKSPRYLVMMKLIEVAVLRRHNCLDIRMTAEELNMDKEII